MIKRPSAKKAQAGGFFSLFFTDDNKHAVKPSQSPRKSSSGFIEMAPGGLNAEHERPSTKNLKPGLLDLIKKEKKIEKFSKRTTISINHKEKEKSTDYDKFKAYFTLLCTLWIRRLKFASGSISVLLTSYTANIIMLLLCGFVRSQVDGDFGVEYDIWKIASPEDMGMANIGLLLPTKAMYNETVNIGFAPCTLDTNGDPVTGDPLGNFITTYRANYPSAIGSTTLSNPMDDWNIQCFPNEGDLEDHYLKNPSNANFGAFILEDPQSLLSNFKEVSYKLRQNATNFGAVDQVYGGSHNTESGLFMYLATFELQMQLHFESSVVNHKLDVSSQEKNLLGMMGVKRAPTTGHYDYEGKDANYLNMAPMYLMMMMSSIVCELLQEILLEKEENFKATLSTSGLPDWAYWAGWAVYMLRQMILPVILILLAATVYVFSSSNAGVLILFFIFTTTSFVALTLSISSFLFTASFGAVLGTVLVWVLSIPGFVLDDPEIAIELKYLVLLLPPCNFAYSLKNFAHAELPAYEESSVGISFGGLFDAPPGEVSLGACLLFLMLDSILYVGIAWYLEQVVPDQWGKCLPPSFIFSKEYWTGELSEEKKEKEAIATALASVARKLDGGPGGDGGHELTADGKAKEVGLDVLHLRKVYGEDPVETVMKEENIHYVIGHEYCKSEALVDSRLDMNKMVKSGAFEAVIYFFIALNMVAIIMDNARFHKNDEDAIMILDMSNYVFCLVFSLEMFYKFYGMSFQNYFKDYFNCFDFLLVMASWVEIIIVGGGASSAAKSAKGAKGVRSVKAAKLARFARMAKMVRVLRIARLLRWFSHDDEKPNVTIALDNLNLKAYKNEILSLLGQNGAGKTTFFSMLMGLSEPTSGQCMVDGQNILISREIVRENVGSCPQHDTLFDYYTVEEHLRLYATMKGIAKDNLDLAVVATLEHVGLTDKAEAFVNHLSGGMRRRTSIAIACLGNPSIVLLDEPSAGVDIVNRQIVWKSLVDLKKNRTIIMSTHFMEEAEILGDRVAVLKKGKLQVIGTCTELHNQFGAGYTLVINRPVNGDLNVENAMIELEHAKKRFVKKGAEIMDEAVVAKMAEEVAKDWKNNLPPPEKPVLRRNIAKAAEEVENAKAREKNAILCDPVKILELVKTFIPEVELLDYTDEQAFLEYILPFESRSQFGVMFEKIDDSKAGFGFEHFGLQAPTLQEVFLEISDLDAMDEDVQLQVKKQGRRRSSVVKSKKNADKKSRRRSSMSGAIRGAIDVAGEPSEQGGLTKVEEEDGAAETRKTSNALANKKMKFSNLKRQDSIQNSGDEFLTTDQLQHEQHLHPELDHGIYAMHNEDIEAHKKNGKHAGTVDEHTVKDFKHRRTSLVGKLSNSLRGNKSASVEASEKVNKGKKRQTMSSSQKYRKQKVILWSEAEPAQHWQRQVKAMVVKRYINGKRNRKGMLLQGVLPIFMVLMGVLFTSINHEIPSGYYTERSLELGDSYSGADLELWTGDSGSKSPLMRFGGDILGDNLGFKNTIDLKSDLNSDTETFVSLPRAFLLGEQSYGQDTSFAQTINLAKNSFTPLKPNLGIVTTIFTPDTDCDETSCDDVGILSSILYYNGTNVRSAAGIVNVIAESMMREGFRLGVKSGDATGAGIKAAYQGFPMTDEEIDVASQPPGIAFVAAILIFMSFASITASQCTDAVAERESGCKRQQLISGVNPILYWVADFVFDYGFYICVPFAATIGIIEAFQVEPFCKQMNQFAAMLVYWGMASTSFAYVGSFIFARAAAAQQMMMTLNTVVALLVMAMVLVLEFVNVPQVATPLRFCAMLVPNCSLGFSLWTFINDGRLDAESTSISDDGMLPCYIMLAEGIVYFVLAIAMENTQDKAAKGYAKSKIGTMDEVKAGSCQPDGKTARSLRKLTESSKFKGLIFGMIIFNMIVIAIDMAEEDSEDVVFVLVVAILNYVFTFIFFMEMALKLGGFGPIVYCRDPFNIFDGILVMLSLVEIVLAGNATFSAAKSGKVVGKSGRMLKLVRVFKFARLLRILRYARFMGVAAQYEVKISSHQMLELAKEEELRKSSTSGAGGENKKNNKCTIVRRLSILGGEYVEGSAVDVERKRIVRRLSQRYSDDVRAKSKELLGDEYKNTAMAMEEEDESPMLKNERGDAIAINNLIKVYERAGATPVTATNDIGFGVRQGEIFSLLGPNGAGKSTVLNMMTGIVAPTSGEIYVLDKNISTQFELIKSRIGFCPQFDALVGHMNSYETLTMFGRIKGIPEEDLPLLVDSLIRCIGLEPHAHKMCMHYSGGNRRKLSVAIALMGNPDIVFLDEPSTGMDPASLTDVYSCVWMWTRGGKNRSIILTTHSMEEADSLSDRIGILVNGKLAVLGTGQQLKSSFGMNYTFESSLQAGDDLHHRVACLEDIIKDNVKGATDDGSFDGRVRYELPQDEVKLSEFFNLLEARREELQIKDYTVSQTTLEQVFIHFAQHQH